MWVFRPNIFLHRFYVSQLPKFRCQCSSNTKILQISESWQIWLQGYKLKQNLNCEIWETMKLHKKNYSTNRVKTKKHNTTTNKDNATDMIFRNNQNRKKQNNCSIKTCICSFNSFCLSYFKIGNVSLQLFKRMRCYAIMSLSLSRNSYSCIPKFGSWVKSYNWLDLGP